MAVITRWSYKRGGRKAGVPLYTEKGKNQVCMLYKQNKILKRSRPVVVENFILF